ncbi:MAG: FGGY family carbohydrate kinase [Acidimicrobiales bacterium]
MGCIVAIDAGTTGVRALAVDESGQVLDLASRELTQHFPRPGWVEHDAAEIWGHVRATVAELVGRVSAAGHTVAAVGLTNQRETAVAWDRRVGTPLHRAIVWQDRRTSARCEALRDQGSLDLVRRTTGLVLDPYFTATKYEWLLGPGQVAAAAGTRDLALATVDSWILWNLTGGTNGGVLATDPTNASRTLLFDTGTRTWSAELCDLFGVPLDALAEVRPSCGELGRVDPGALPAVAGIPVCAMAGDQQAALFGQACFEPGLTKVTYGTGSFVLMNVGHERPDPSAGLLTSVAWDLGDHAPDGTAVTYALEGSALTSGAAIQWLRDGLGLIGQAAEIGPLAASVPDSGGVTVVPAFTGLGSPWWDPRARGTVVGITRGTGRAQLARAVVEAMAFQVRDMVDAMTSATGQPCPQLRADGGAAVMGLLLQLQADVLQTAVVRPRCTESTALGAATLAGLGAGMWGSTAELATLWKPDVARQPQLPPELADLAYTGWQRAVARARAWAVDREE